MVLLPSVFVSTRGAKRHQIQRTNMLRSCSQVGFCVAITLAACSYPNVPVDALPNGEIHDFTSESASLLEQTELQHVPDIPQTAYPTDASFDILEEAGHAKEWDEGSSLTDDQHASVLSHQEFEATQHAQLRSIIGKNLVLKGFIIVIVAAILFTILAIKVPIHTLEFLDSVDYVLPPDTTTEEKQVARNLDLIFLIFLLMAGGLGIMGFGALSSSWATKTASWPPQRASIETVDAELEEHDTPVVNQELPSGDPPSSDLVE
ncbi:hypothetical protein cyc_01734 [Cyclospora cayetanensis]|uniref:Transmembrane protein n=1 Tax=Cyclospora cayetanensis TaxID=88456 RepID=A0A1D3CS49_9EIME|nr:hypothetical protein cyc_01734 [Cyclospora cayetanensis]